MMEPDVSESEAFTGCGKTNRPPVGGIESFSRDFEPAHGKRTLKTRREGQVWHRERPAQAPATLSRPPNGFGVIRICRLRLALASGISARMELWPSG